MTAKKKKKNNNWEEKSSLLILLVNKAVAQELFAVQTWLCEMAFMMWLMLH